MSRQKARLHLLVLLISFALAAGLLYYSVRGIEWSRVGQILGSALIPWVLLYCCTTSCALFLRAYRWRILLRAEGDVSVPLVFHATAAGYFGNNFLPARAGEVVRTVMVSSRTPLSKAFVLTTAFSERIADAIALITISAVALLAIPQRPGWLQSAARPLALLGFAGVLCIALLPFIEGHLLALLDRLPLPASLRSGVAHVTLQVVRGVRSFHDPGRIAGFIALTLVIWCVDAVGAVVVARSLVMALAVPVAFLMIAGLGLGSALPSTPGYVGIYQFVAVSVLTPFGFGRSGAIAYVLLLQALGFVTTTAWGLLALLWHRQRPQWRTPAT